LFRSINSLKLPQRDSSGGISVRLIQPPLEYWKKSSCALTDVSILPGSSGGGFFSVGFADLLSVPAGALVSTGGGGFPVVGLGLPVCGFGEVPTTGDFSGSVCARKADAHKQIIRISGIDLNIRQETARRVIVQLLL